MLRPQNDSMNIDQLQNLAINAVEGVCGIACRPVEMILRPWHGTRYFPVPVIFLSTMLMIFLPLMSAMATGITQMLPFAGFQPPIGLFGIGSFSKLYFVLSFIHGIRLWRLMLHMEKEAHSEYEGPPLFFLQLLPGSGSFWKTRILLEPGFLFVAATVFGHILIFQSGLTLYCQVTAFALGMKEYIAWFRMWLFLREMMDAKCAGPIIARMVDNRATEEDLASIHLASFPKNLPHDIREAAVSHIARAFSAETETGPKPPEKEAGSKPPSN